MLSDADMMNRSVFFLGLGCGVLLACSASREDATGAAGALGDNGAVPRFTAEEASSLGDWAGRLRVSQAGAPYKQIDVASARSTCATDERPYELSFDAGGAIAMGFGRANEFPPRVGEYTCADHGARIAKVSWDSQGKATALNASTCTVVIDDVGPQRPRTSARRISGHFEAQRAAGGLPDALVGTFVVDVAGDSPGTELCGH